jgi:hypothetical protein
MSLMNKAVGVLNGAAAAGKSVASDLMTATSRVVDAATAAASNPATPASGTTAATAAAGTPPAGTADAAAPGAGAPDGTTSR